MKPHWQVEMERLGDAAPFDSQTLFECQEWVEENPQRALDCALDASMNGRIRWLMLESVALHGVTDALRGTLVSLLSQESLDPWLLNGVPAVIRTVSMGTHREATRIALRDWLLRVRAEPTKFRPNHRLQCAVGELCMTFGSFAEAADAQLLCEFVIGPWPHKPFINACDAMERVVRRHALNPEIDECFRVNRRALHRRGMALENVYHILEYSGACLASWFDMMISRLGPEGIIAVRAEKNPALLRVRLPVSIKKAEKALCARNYPDEWMTLARERAESWLATVGLKKEDVFRSTDSA